MRITTFGGLPRLELGSQFQPYPPGRTVTSVHDARAAALAAARWGRELQEVADALAGLPEGWRIPDPGKDGPAYWFLGLDDQRVVVHELLPAGQPVFQGDVRGWAQHTARARYGPHDLLGMVSPYFKVVPFAEVARRPCPACERPQPLVERYTQVAGSPQGDAWRREQVVLCCGRVQVLTSDTQGYRT